MGGARLTLSLPKPGSFVDGIALYRAVAVFGLVSYKVSNCDFAVLGVAEVAGYLG